jgi:hypothetical protein
MTAAPLALVVTLASFAVAVIVARWCWRPLQRAALAPARDGRCDANDLLFLRLAPVLTAAVIVCVLIVPAFVRFEPRGRTESAGPPILILAVVGAAIVGASLLRAFGAIQATRVLTREWLAAARPLVLPDLRLPAYVVDVPYPLVAATGIVRQRLFVSSDVFNACTDAELTAILAHEAGHVRMADNLRRLIIRACPDALAPGRGERALERAWSAAAEDAADRFALGRGTADVDLASALVTVARIGSARPIGALASTFLEDEVERRVLRVLGRSRQPRPPAWIRLLRPAGLVLLVIVISFAFAPGSLARIHQAVELGVGFLR